MLALEAQHDLIWKQAFLQSISSLNRLCLTHIPTHGSSCAIGFPVMRKRSCMSLSSVLMRDLLFVKAHGITTNTQITYTHSILKSYKK